MTQMEQSHAPEADVVLTPAGVSLFAAGARRLGIFAGFIAVASILLHIAITTGLRRIDASRFGVSNAIVDGVINADILIAGSSRALTHYDPRIITEKTGLSAYNIGLNGAQTDMQFARVKTYLRHNKSPLALLFNLDVFSFQVTHGGVYDPAQYMPYLNEPDIYDALRRIDSVIWKSKYIPLYGYTVEDLRFNWMLGLAGLFRWRPKEDHFKGFLPRETAWTDDFRRLRDANPDGVRFAMETAGVEQIRELLRLCQDRGIRLILVFSPEYAEMQKITKNRSEVFNQFGALSHQFDALFWDYSDSDISANLENFYNSQHLNALGAERFSRRIADRLAAEPQIAAAAAHAQKANAAGK